MSKEQPKKQLKNIARVSGIGVQLAAAVFVGAYLGNYLDDKYPISEKRLYTLLLTLAFLGVGLYTTLKQINRK
jgi:F0F1-type ATP synthase assembly protein I